jgi:hypothetical protein
MALKRIKPLPRTPEQIADDEQVRELFQDRPSVRSLIERGDQDVHHEASPNRQPAAHSSTSRSIRNHDDP